MRMSKGLREPRRPFRGAKPAAKRAVNLSIDAEILAAAKAQGINLSQTLEDELRRKTEDARVKAWRNENRAALDSHNRFIDENGIWSDAYRSWGKAK
jgi:antitoxin CcdA